MIPDDPHHLRQRIDHARRALDSLHKHLPDLHTLAWEPTNSRDPLEERVSGEDSAVKTDQSPRAGDPRARRLYARIATELATWQAEVTGLERAMTRLFRSAGERPDQTRGVYPMLVTAAEHDRALAAQRQRRNTGEHVPERLEPQPSHPGKGRR